MSFLEPSDKEVWCFFGFGMSPFLLRNLVQLGNDHLRNVRWVVVLPTGHHENMVLGLESVQDILVVDRCSRDIQGGWRYTKDPDTAAWSIFRDLDAQKFVGKPWSRSEREEDAIRMSHSLNEFLSRTRPSVLLYPQPVETPLGMILYREAQKLGIRVCIPYHLRFCNRSYFSGDVREVPSKMPRLQGDWLSQAKLVRESFMNGTLQPKYLERSASGNVLSEWSRSKRLRFFVRNLASSREVRRISALRVSLFSTWFPLVWKLIQKARGAVNSRICDFEDLDLNEMKYVFFPLQYTPESSINVPEPFYIDQLRVIDAVRYSMPSDHILVVKEHPAAIGVRKRGFLREVRKRPGVRIIKWDHPTRALIENASLTVSVTGTAAFEAFLLGRPSLVFAPTFFSEQLGGAVRLEELRTTICQKREPLSSIEVDEGLADLLAGSRPFVCVAPESLGGLTLEASNIESMVEALVEWLKLEVPK